MTCRQTNQFFIFFILVTWVCARKRLDEGDACRLASGIKGICRQYDACKSARTQKQGLLICRYIRKNGRKVAPIVCCEESATLTTSTQTAITQLIPITPMPRIIYKQSRPLQQRPSIAAKKCEQYSKWIAPHKTYFEDVKEFTAGECGIDSESFILGGTQTKPLEFPHMARLGFGLEGDAPETLTWDCGGSLISEKFVLTAAHCLRNKQGLQVISVRLGHGDPKRSKVVKVRRSIALPYYKPSEKYNDIALLELLETIVFNDYVRPACLYTEYAIHSTQAVASGWGLTEKRKLSRKLLKVELPVQNYQNCSKAYPADKFLKYGIIDGTMFCAGEEDSQKDTCQGDSGGPIQIPLRIPQCMYAVVGITSFGFLCGVAPGVYTRVSAFVPWIERIVWPT